MFEQCCGTCLHCKNVDGEWTCLCEAGDYFGCETEYEHTCDDYEER